MAFLARGHHHFLTVMVGQLPQIEGLQAPWVWALASPLFRVDLTTLGTSWDVGEVQI